MIVFKKIFSFKSTLVICFLILCYCLQANASFAEDKYENIDPSIIYEEGALLAKSLRCVVCQNQSLYDSEALISQKIKQEIYTMLQNKASKPEIIDSLIARYGEVISYEPQKNIVNIWLWLLPVVFVLIGMWLVFNQARK